MAKKRIPRLQAQPGPPVGEQIGAFPRQPVYEALGETALAKLDLAAFDDFFGERFALYRHVVEGMHQLLSPAELRELLVEAELLGKRYRKVLWLVASDLNVECVESEGVLFEGFFAPVDQKLVKIGRMVTAAQKRNAGRLGQLGQPSLIYRDRFLHDVAFWLGQHGGLRRGEAATKAAAVLNAVGVAAPADRDAEKVVNRIGRTSREN